MLAKANLQILVLLQSDVKLDHSMLWKPRKKSRMKMGSIKFTKA